MRDFIIIYHQNVLDRVESYRKALLSGTRSPGMLLAGRMKGANLEALSPQSFLNLMLNTKKPQIFAESQVHGDGSDWSQEELSIMGDVGVAVQVQIFDDGKHYHPEIHKVPFNGTLLFIPGALLRSNGVSTPCDLNEVTEGNDFNYAGYYKLYERRLLPLFEYIQSRSELTGKKAVVTIPGLGCGQFAGRFSGRLGEQLKRFLEDFLIKYAINFPMISLVFFDPFNECEVEEKMIDELCFRVRPLQKVQKRVSQLASVKDFEEKPDDFADHELYSIAAWDHVSWPGNDFYLGARATDDGVKAAATDLMSRMTGIKGEYSPSSFSYNPPAAHDSWAAVVKEYGLQFLEDEMSQ